MLPPGSWPAVRRRVGDEDRLSTKALVVHDGPSPYRLKLEYPESERPETVMSTGELVEIVSTRDMLNMLNEDELDFWWIGTNYRAWTAAVVRAGRRGTV
jgi:hypothetical protein